jgi:ribosomal protein S4
MSRKLKLKSLLQRQTLSVGFGIKVKKLSRKKWFFLKGLLYRLNKKFWFLDQGLETARSSRRKIKLSFLQQQQSFKSAKLFFSRLRKIEIQKRTSFILKRINKNRSIQLLNFFERRLVVLLLRSGFFDRLSAAVKAIRRGDVYVNGKKICSPQHILSVHDFVSLKGLALSEVRASFSKRKEIALQGRVNPLFLKQKLVTRNHLAIRTQGNPSKRLSFCSSSSQLISELFFIEDLRRRDLKRYRRNNSSLWPSELNNPKVPSYLLVDYRSLSLYLKSSVYTSGLSTFYRQNLELSKFWRL